jgi:hypothetical protein
MFDSGIEQSISPISPLSRVICISASVLARFKP